MVKEEADANVIDPPWLHLLSAFLAMESPDFLISISRDCGGGEITECVQNFIWDHCISRVDGKGYVPYIRTFLKKLIVEIESTGAVVIDELYEQLAFYMTSFKGDDLTKGDLRIINQISFLYPNAPSCQSSRKLVIPLQCSLNMLEGDTGCFIWPASLFLSEFILSCPELFSMKSCFEIGSGVGLVGICLAHVKPSKVLLSDGDLSSLANLKVNLELNQVCTRFGLTEGVLQDLNTVKCLHLPWESACESELQDLMADIVLGADVIYDPQCIPHLVRVLAALLTTKKTKPVAYIASVVRNIDTFNYFVMLAEQANLTVADITENVRLLNLLPYMLSYQRSSVSLLRISHS